MTPIQTIGHGDSMKSELPQDVLIRLLFLNSEGQYWGIGQYYEIGQHSGIGQYSGIGHNKWSGQ